MRRFARLHGVEKVFRFVGELIEYKDRKFKIREAIRRREGRNIMSMRIDGLPSQYSRYKINVDRVKQEIEKQKNSSIRLCDQAEISEEGKKALESRMSALAGERHMEDIRHLSSVSSYGYINDFEKALSDLEKGNVSGEYLTGAYEKDVEQIASKFEEEEGEKTDSFDRHINKAVAAYNMMRDRIEAKYADSQRETEYYVTDHGEIKELTKEKELEMLDKAYANHSTFLATSTQVWADLQDFTPTVVYHKDSQQSDEEASVSESRKEEVTEHSEKGQVKDMVSKAFMSAIRDGNRRMLSQHEGSLNHFKLNLGISELERDRLNSIWNFYANKR